MNMLVIIVILLGLSSAVKSKYQWGSDSIIKVSKGSDSIEICFGSCSIQNINKMYGAVHGTTSTICYC